jgi:teichuronic acid biosynthesis glycosyltransferase TuaH
MLTEQIDELVVLSLEPWDEVWRRNQHIVGALLEQRPTLRVLFVEPPVDLVTNIRHGQWPEHVGLRAVAARLWALRPLRAIPTRLAPKGSLVFRQVRRAYDQLHLRHPVLWVNDASYARALLASPHPVVYDITDDWTLAEAPAREWRRRRADDERLMDRSEAIVVCSPGLVESRGRHRSVVLIPNAVDVAAYRKQSPRPADLPHETSAVYVGTLHDERVDVPLCLDLVSVSSNLHLVLVGPDSLRPGSRSVLAAHPRIHLLGARPAADVPAYLQHADVLVVPHLVSPFTDSLDPIKAYEYQAARRPTVATPVAGFRDLPWARIATRADFPEEVLAALGSSVPAVADPPSWFDRARAFGEVLDSSVISRRDQGFMS